VTHSAEKDALAWGEMPYDRKTVAEVVHDYAVVRGDPSEQYARDQLVLWIERYAQEMQAQALEEAADERGELWSGSCGSVHYDCAEHVSTWLHERARFTRIPTRILPPGGQHGIAE
jgi:hypothetical protein